MTAKLFELEWQGGAAEKSFRRVRPDVEDLPWGTTKIGDVPPAILDRARTLWTQVALSEYRAALGFSEVLRAMLAAGAPLDLVGMAGSFVADEVAHVEMASRLAMELGGAAPVMVDWDAFLRTAKNDDAFSYANDRILTNVCISETMSGAIALDTFRALEAPLPAAVLKIIAQDEARHTRVGWLYLEWASPRMTDEERTRLCGVLEKGLRPFAPLLSKKPRTAYSEADREKLLRLGWLDRAPYAASARRSAEEDVLAPLAAYGITLAESAHAELFEDA
jgi:hypothetical protein